MSRVESLDWIQRSWYFYLVSHLNEKKNQKNRQLLRYIQRTAPQTHQHLPVPVDPHFCVVSRIQEKKSWTSIFKIFVPRFKNLEPWAITMESWTTFFQDWINLGNNLTQKSMKILRPEKLILGVQHKTLFIILRHLQHHGSKPSKQPTSTENRW